MLHGDGTDADVRAVERDGHSTACADGLEGCALAFLRRADLSAHCFVELETHALTVTSASNPVLVSQPGCEAIEVRCGHAPVVLLDGARLSIGGKLFLWEYAVATAAAAEEDDDRRPVDLELVARAVVNTPAPPPRPLRRSPRRSQSPDRSIDSPSAPPSRSCADLLGIYEDVVRGARSSARLTPQHVALAPAADEGEDPFADPAVADVPESIGAESDSDSEIESLLISPRVAASVPLPDSPDEPLAQTLGLASSPSSPTPIRALSSPLPDRLPSKGPSRRLSLREKCVMQCSRRR